MVSVTDALVSHDSRLRLPIVTQTNEQADDLVLAIRSRHPNIVVARLHGSRGGPSKAMLGAVDPNLVLHHDNDSPHHLIDRVNAYHRTPDHPNHGAARQGGRHRRRSHRGR